MHTIVKNIQQNNSYGETRKTKGTQSIKSNIQWGKRCALIFWRSQEYIGILAVHGAQYLSSRGS